MELFYRDYSVALRESDGRGIEGRIDFGDLATMFALHEGIYQDKRLLYEMLRRTNHVTISEFIASAFSALYLSGAITTEVRKRIEHTFMGYMDNYGFKSISVPQQALSQASGAGSNVCLHPYVMGTLPETFYNLGLSLDILGRRARTWSDLQMSESRNVAQGSGRSDGSKRAVLRVRKDWEEGGVSVSATLKRRFGSCCDIYDSETIDGLQSPGRTERNIERLIEDYHKEIKAENGQSPSVHWMVLVGSTYQLLRMAKELSRLVMKRTGDLGGVPFDRVILVGDVGIRELFRRKSNDLGDYLQMQSLMFELVEHVVTNDH